MEGADRPLSLQRGLVGCVRMLDVNNMVYNLQEKGGQVLYGSAVGECGNDPCLPNPCKNGASCQVKEAEMFHCKCASGFSGPTCADTHNPCDPNHCHPSSQCKVLPEGGYKCECPMEREGKHCERVSKTDKNEAYMPSFNGDSYLEMKGLHTFGHDLQEKVNMTVVFLANDSNGLIFYNGQKDDGKGDFISLGLNDGILEFRYDLGKGPAVIRSREKVKLSAWNTVKLERVSRKGEISVNGARERVRGVAEPQQRSQPEGISIILMGIPILKRENALSSSDVSTFPHHPCAQGVCKNGGHCLPQLEGYECVCKHGFSGTDCKNGIVEKSAGQADSIAFDGRTFIEYHNAVSKSEKAMLTNAFELSIKTEATHGLLLWSGKGTERSDYIALAVVDGRVQMTFDLGSKPAVLRSSVRVDTNRWTRIKASRTLRDGFLQVGNEAAVTGSSPWGPHSWTQMGLSGWVACRGPQWSAVCRRRTARASLAA
ncbi:hypothetical protein ANANG_G00245990 [Anguilla anguilla]|uniref:Agrin n=1 Tax=Anguilla anguilla TaxID=7936 RepID=A0A9D3LRH6_ANGAN|nr:hypothetical protein ANANG_G00245990 [Anguilla anguilla]